MIVTFAASLGCGDDQPGDAVSLPVLDADVVVAGFAPLGRAVAPTGARVLSPIPDTLAVPELGVEAVDGFVGGLRRADLPTGLLPTELRFSAPGPRTRPLPLLRSPHLYDRADPPGRFAPVSSTGGPGPNPSEDRLSRLLADLHVERPCSPPETELTVTIPRTPAEGLLPGLVTPDGAVWLGMVATGTAAALRLRPDGRPEVIGLPLPPPLDEGRPRASVRFMGGYDGAGGPSRVVIDVSGGFTQAAVVLERREDGRWADATPNLPDAEVRSLRGVAELGSTTCTFGGVRGASRDAGLWCREGLGPWRLELRVPAAQAITGVYLADDGGWIASDRSGGLHRREPSGAWRTVSEAEVNAGCRPACAPFDLSVATGDALLLGGEEAQLFLAPLDADPRPAPVEALAAASFGDEREGGPRAVQPISAGWAPDGRWWIGSADGALWRFEPGSETMERVCLPPESLEGDRPLSITAVVVAPDGRLVLGLAGGRLGIGRWN